MPIVGTADCKRVSHAIRLTQDWLLHQTKLAPKNWSNGQNNWHGTQAPKAGELQGPPTHG
ncbi:hypothetical protein GCM10022404_21670 [Celeribacter arenosi]|uniref:Uncharacterized protein n=1 Tax=Celeribacter arenosi TaxID=792649 RepID=A0ABP7KCG4_9RHOB